MANEISLNALIPVELKEEFEIACVRRRQSQKAAVAEALRLWIEGQASGSVDFGDLRQNEVEIAKGAIALARSGDADALHTLSYLLRGWPDKFREKASKVKKMG